MKHISVLIKPASGLCNFQCVYCFYQDTYNHRLQALKIMSETTVDNLLARIFGKFNEDTYITFMFQGGEPLLAGIGFFNYFITQVDELKESIHQINYGIQTNGSLIDHEFLKLFKHKQFLVGLSLDGFAENHNYYRRYDSQDSFDVVGDCYNKLLQWGIEVNILTVLTKGLMGKAGQLYRFYQSLDIKYIQLIPCIDDTGDYRCELSELSGFYQVIFDEVEKEYLKGNYRSINFIENIMMLVSNKLPYQCGYIGRCFMQWVIESDGSVYPCDFYCQDEYRLGNINADSIDDISGQAVLKQFLGPKGLVDICLSCDYRDSCHGHCKKMSNLYYDDHFCVIKQFIKNNYSRLISLAKTLNI